MPQQNIRVRTFSWVFVQNEVDKTSNLRRACLHLKLLSYNFGQIFSIHYSKRVFICEEFMSQCSKSPNIYFLIVSLALQYFRR